METVPANELGTQSLFQPLPRLLIDHSVRNGGNALGLEAIEDDSVIWLLSSTVASKRDEPALREKAAEFTTHLAEYARSIGALRDWQYMNYADPTQSPFESYGQRNVDFLWQVSGKYDPKGFFQKRMEGGFKLPDKSHVNTRL